MKTQAVVGLGVIFNRLAAKKPLSDKWICRM